MYESRLLCSMLSRKGSCAGMSAALAGVDRSRVGERLQAALAGLQELHLLKDRQSDMVSWALRVDREEPVSSVQAGTEDPNMRVKEQRLGATLTALKQQLSRLRKQDVGLKTHLQQLDQQINELKLDVNKVSTDQMESDSRPSSGFYELSDGGSCSLSNSCVSVYSECLSSSQTSLLHPSTPANSHINPPAQVDVCHQRSADESTTQPHPPRAVGLHLGSSRIRVNAEQKRPRPVSTGDLDAMLTQGLGYFMFVDQRKPLMCPKLKSSTVDPKFQSNLVSRTGAEVYPYPSPLHAVALQSPIFSVGGEPTIPGLLEGQGPPTNSSDTLQKAQMGYETMTQTYIDRLLVRSFNKVKTDTGPEDVQTHSECQRNLAKVVTVVPEVPQRDKSVVQPHSVQTTSSSLDNSQKRNCMTYSSQERADNANVKQPVKVPDTSFRYSYPARSRDCTTEESTISSMRKKDNSKGEFPLVVKNNSENKCVDKPESRLQTRSGPRQKIVMGHSSSTKESQCLEGKVGHITSPDFVHAEFVPAGSHRVKVRQADHKTKAVKLRRKSNEKPRAVRQQHGYSSGEKAREASGGSKGEQRRAGKGKVTKKFTTCYAEEQTQGSGSESSHSSPGLMYTHKVPPKTHPTPVVTKSSKNRRILSLDYEQPLEQRKKKQGSSDVEMFHLSCSQHYRSKGPQAQGSMQMVHMNDRSGQWMGPPGSFQTPVSPHSFLHNLNARYPPSPFHMSRHYPPRCESEYSAECASLFHSTIAESSEGEMSDNTTNRFGDSESSQSFLSFSDSDSSLSLDEDYQVDNQGEERNLVWAEDSLGPTAAGLQQLPRPEPSACRIKASRALKKKIRRFQPASLKVMTLV
eukprot:XP_003963752.2 PREDICTED: dapper homolog 2-like [Takifugu rubripes]